jgi:Tol biopolymer transport system component
MFPSLKCFGYLLLIMASLLTCSKKSTNGVKPPSPAYPIICDVPAWSPDGKTIAYYYNGTIKVHEWGAYTVDPNLRGIWFISPDETNKRMFLWGGDLPDWNPVEPKLIFVMNAQIHTIKLNGDSLTQLTFEGRNFFPDWSPDGKKIAYSVSTPVESGGIWIIDSRDNSEKHLGLGYMPDWAPDTSHVVFSGSGAEIWTADTNGANSKQLTFLGGDSRYPQWSPDGSKIVFSSQKIAAGYHLPQIWVMNSDGTNLKELTREGGRYPAWSPDGNKIVYVRENPKEYSSKQGQLWLMNSDGSNKRQLTFDGW